MARAVRTKDIEELPESDRLDEFPHPRHTDILYGHDEALSFTKEAFSTGRVHHAWLVTGPKGIGKATLSYRIARWVLATAEERAEGGRGLDNPAGSRTSAQVSALSHPGLLVIRRPYNIKAKRFAASIPVDEVRRLRSFLSLKAAADSWRVIIVDSADELNINAANALLKSLEEPPARALFLLVSSQPGRLLPTIRSRCRLLNLDPLASQPLRQAALQALSAADMGREDAGLADLEAFAGGSVRALLTLKAGGGDKLHKEARDLLGGLPRVDWLRVHKLAEELASVAAAQRFDTFFDLLFELLHRGIRAGAAGADDPKDLQLAVRLAGLPGGDAGAGLADSARLASWAALWETMQRNKADILALNLDRKSFILDCVTQMERLARSG